MAWNLFTKYHINTLIVLLCRKLMRFFFSFQIFKLVCIFFVSYRLFSIYECAFYDEVISFSRTEGFSSFKRTTKTKRSQLPFEGEWKAIALPKWMQCEWTCQNNVKSKERDAVNVVSKQTMRKKNRKMNGKRLKRNKWVYILRQDLVVKLCQNIWFVLIWFF